MNVAYIDTAQQLYDIINSRTIDPNIDGLYAAFWATMRTFRDPKVCSCKKGVPMQQNLANLYVRIANESGNQPLLSIAQRLLGSGHWVFRINGTERARVVS